MMRSLALSSLALLFAASVALAAGLSTGDYRMLAADYGLRQDSLIMQDMTAAETAKLHAILNDPGLAEYPKARSANAGDFLYKVHIRECESWRQKHSGPEMCQPSGDPQVDLGQDIAERQCNFCHLFGTSKAPSFRSLAARNLTARQLADALATGHQMSPIGLQPNEMAALSAYIVSMK